MVHKIKLALAGLLLAFGLAAGYALPVAAQAGGSAGQAKADVCAGINVTGGTCNESGAGLSGVMKVVVSILSVITGFAAVIMIIVGGIKYVTSGGDSSKISSAKSTIIYAIVGLVIVALAQVIVRFVAGKAAGR